MQSEVEVWGLGPRGSAPCQVDPDTSGIADQLSGRQADQQAQRALVSGYRGSAKRSATATSSKEETAEHRNQRNKAKTHALEDAASRDAATATAETTRCRSPCCTD